MSGFESRQSSAFESHVASGFESFGSSALGVTIVMNFIDEAQWVYNPDGVDQWDADLAELETELEKAVENAIGLMHPAGGGQFGNDDINNLKPDDREFSDAVDIHASIGRPPSQAELINQFNALRDVLASKMELASRDNVPLHTLMVDIDGSGSMQRSSIEPGIDDFLDWMGENHAEVDVRERVYTNERWLHQSAVSIRLATEEIEEEE